MKLNSLKAKISLTIIIIEVLTVLLISLFSNFLINEQFKTYLANKQEIEIKEIVASLSNQYNMKTQSWNFDSLHTLSIDALFDGYIIKVIDNQNNVVWNTEEHDVQACREVMKDIEDRMRKELPEVDGQFTSHEYDLTKSNQDIGQVIIRSYGPYFLSQNDFDFLASLNSILQTVGVLAIVLSIATGWLLAKRISEPILKAFMATKQMAKGNYNINIKEKTKTRELDGLVESINSLAEKLNNQEVLRKQLTADVAHELRTPLTTLSTHMEAMIEGIWDPSTERLQCCHEEIQRIHHLVYDLENLAKVESDNVQLEKEIVDLKVLIQKAIESFEVIIQKKMLKVTVQGMNSQIYLDMNRMTQVMLNLLSNAIKYTPGNGCILITLLETENDVLIKVDDNGIGIPEKEVPFVFERFYRADKSRNRMTGGTGIGLAIVKAIVEAHGGHISVKSTLGAGTSFTVCLPKQDEKVIK